MSDIVDEILAATHHKTCEMWFPQPVFPSPRGVQHDFSPIATILDPPLSFSKPAAPPQQQPQPQQPQPQQPQPQQPQPQQQQPQPPPPTQHLHQHQPPQQSQTQPPHLHRSTHSTTASPRKRPNPSAHPTDSATRSPRKKALTAPMLHATAVMPPSAKSILERREKAIREGRRKDAKLTDTERRILRRLRNRESAERCRLRRVQQAALLQQRINEMQVENERLVTMAHQYECTIRRLELVIRQLSAGAAASAHGGSSGGGASGNGGSAHGADDDEVEALEATL